MMDVYQTIGKKEDGHQDAPGRPVSTHQWYQVIHPMVKYLMVIAAILCIVIWLGRRGGGVVSFFLGFFPRRQTE